MTKYDNQRQIPIIRDEFMGFDLGDLIVLDTRQLDHEHPISFDRAQSFLERDWAAPMLRLLNESDVKEINQKRFRSFLNWVQNYNREAGDSGPYLRLEPIAIIVGDYGFSSLHDEGEGWSSTNILLSSEVG